MHNMHSITLHTASVTLETQGAPCLSRVSPARAGGSIGCKQGKPKSILCLSDLETRKTQEYFETRKTQEYFETSKTQEYFVLVILPTTIKR